MEEQAAHTMVVKKQKQEGGVSPQFKGTLRHVQKTSYKSPRLKGFVSSQLWHGLKRKAITNTWACEDIQNPTTASVKHFNLGL